MNTNQFRHYINLIESRIPDLEYQDNEQQVIAVLKSYNSQVYTKLAQKVERIDQLEAEIKMLKEEVKNETRENIADLFDADDAVKTRVVQTMSFILTLSKDPKATVSPKYKDILEELATQLTPELIIVLENLKKQLVTVTQKSPSLRIAPVDEGRFGDLFARFKQKVFGWATRYDQKLSMLQQAAAD
jgi:uncharacterized protein (UPF0335 family)